MGPKTVRFSVFLRIFIDFVAKLCRPGPKGATNRGPGFLEPRGVLRTWGFLPGASLPGDLISSPPYTRTTSRTIRTTPRTTSTTRRVVLVILFVVLVVLEVVLVVLEVVLQLLLLQLLLLQLLLLQLLLLQLLLLQLRVLLKLGATLKQKQSVNPISKTFFWRVR